MTTNSHINSGFRSIAISDTNGNVIGANVQELTVSNVANFTVGGGSNGQALTTNGSGNLSWTTIPGIIGVADYLENGTSNVFITTSGPITMSSNGVANIVTLTATTTTFTGTSNLNDISNIQLAGGNPDKYIQTDGLGNLSWGPDQFIIPEGGYGYGKTFARGDKLWVSGAIQAVYASGESAGISMSRNVNITPNTLESFVPKLEYFVKIYDCNTSIYALGNNGIMYTMGVDTSGSTGATTDIKTQFALFPLTGMEVYGPGITVENFWAPDEITGIATTLGHCIIRVNDNGTIKYYGFGNNTSGTLGIGNITNQQVPVEITTLRNKNLVSVSMTSQNTMVATSTGEVWATGLNANGQIGIGSIADSNVFVQSTLAAGNVVISNAVEVQTSLNLSPEGYVSFARLNDGTVVAAGWGVNNRLSKGSTSNSTRFAPVLKSAGIPLTGIVKIRSRCADTMALDNLGNLWAWGVNYENLWGNGDAINTSATYAKIIQSGVSDFWITSKAQGQYRSMIFTKTDGTTWGCGSNFSYQLGVDTNNTSNVVTALPIYYGEKGEYCVMAKALGLSSGTSYFNAIIHLTNKNRVYVVGDCGEYAGSYGYSSRISTPVPITDILYY